MQPWLIKAVVLILNLYNFLRKELCKKAIRSCFVYYYISIVSGVIVISNDAINNTE